VRIRVEPHPVFPAAALGFALIGFFERPMAERRPRPPEMRAGLQLLVTSPRDSGPGSLREAIIAADRAPDRALIEIRTGRIVLETPLPPLVNPKGVILEAPNAGAEIDGSGLAAGALLDLASPRSVVAGLTIRGAAEQGVLVRSQGVRLRGLTVADCGEGVHVLEGAGDLLLEASSFDGNGTGVHVEPGARAVEIYESRFRNHDKAGVWAVSPSPPSQSTVPVVSVRQSRFEGDRMSLVLIDVPALVEDNQFLRPLEAAAYLTGAAVVRRNRVEGGASMGLYGDAVDGAVLEDNEVSHSQVAGILLRDSRNSQLRRNRLFGNAYGIAVLFDAGGAPNLVGENLVANQSADGIFVVAAAPVLQANRILGNRLAGLRVLDYVPIRGPRLAGRPLVRDDNVMENNGSDAQVRGEYREPPPASQGP